MNEMWDAAAVAEQFSTLGIEPDTAVRLAEAVRSHGAAAVPALGAGAFADWRTASTVNRLVAQAFDAGATTSAVAAELEVVAQLQAMQQRELAFL
jgi:hypothetical protein